MSAGPVLTVRDLHVRFDVGGSSVHAVNGISFELADGEALAIVGESGSGKSATALATMGLLPTAATITAGAIRVGDHDVLDLDQQGWQRVRGRSISMIYQDPMTALNPRVSIGKQFGMVLRHHFGMSRRAARQRAAELLRLVRIPDPAGRLDDYPHQLSGGQRQRVLIALALSCEPKVLVADEPTTALDTTVQAQIVDLVNELRERLGMAVMWITHDLGVVSDVVDRIVVMYGGTLVEESSVSELFRRPRHPYTIGLLGSLPSGDPQQRRLDPIPGSPPSLRSPLTGCPFQPRCAWATDECDRAVPELLTVSAGHHVACIHAEAVTAPGSAVTRDTATSEARR